MKTIESPTPHRHSPLAIAIAAGLMLLSTGTVLAQQPASTATNAPDQATPEQGVVSPNQTQDATTLDTIIVTANKRRENIRKIAGSISVVTAEQLDNLHATQLTDFAAYVPGLQVTSSGTPGKTSISLRGIAPLSSGSTIGTYIDETPVGSSGIYQGATSLALDLLPYDIGRVEVLRGPQGTLYGAGAMGGLLKYVTVDPDLTTREFRIGGGISDVEGADNYGWNGRFSANVPLVQDRFALRVSYARNKIPGFIDNAVDGRKDINDGRQESARVSGLWKINDAASLKVTAIRQTIDSDNNALVALDANQRPLLGDLTNTVFVNEPFKKNINYFSATLDWDLGWADFISASGYSNTDTRSRVDATQIYGEFANLALGLPTPGSSYLDLHLKLKKYTQEFRLTSKDTGPFEWQLGAFYTKEDGNNTQFLALRQRDGTPLPAPFDSIAGTLADAAIPSTYKETALFANGAYAFNDRFKLGAGVRFSRNDQDFTQIISGGLLLPLGTSPNSSHENVFTYSVSPQFQLTKDALLYAKIATGYQPGGPNVVVAGLPPIVDSSTLTSYELGLKSAFADHRVLFDLTAFRINWKDIQVITVSNGFSGLVNGGKATSQGLELSTVYRPTDGLRLGVNAAYTDATLAEDFKTITLATSPVIVELNTGLAGDRLPYVPKYSWSATADYYFPLGAAGWNGHVGAGFRWVGNRVAATSSRQVVSLPTVPPTVLQTKVTPPLRLDSYKALDLNADISNLHWTFRAYVKNVTDERAYLTIANVTSGLTGVTDHLVAAPIQPRTFGLEVDYSF